MTKILFSCLLACIVFSANAQIKKNAILLGGDVSLNAQTLTTNSDYKSHYNNGNIVLSIGKAVAENAVVGLNVGLTPYRNKLTFGNYYPDSSLTYKSFGYSVGVFYRKYKLLAKDLYFFGQVNANYSYQGPVKRSGDGSNQLKYTSNSVYANFAPGVSYRLYKKLYVEANVAVIGVRYDENETSGKDLSTKSSQFLLGTVITSGNTLKAMNLGFRFVI